MISNHEKFIRVTAGLNNLDFIRLRDGFIPLPTFRVYDVVGSDLYFKVSYNPRSDRFSIAYLSKKPTRWQMEFDDFLDRLPDDAKENILFNLDLFR
jgi:hypothetical protein